jgi:hypothetical protein
MVRVKKQFAQKQKDKEDLTVIVMKNYHKSRIPGPRPEMFDIFEKPRKK